jgi:hypothetical protein
VTNTKKGFNEASLIKSFFGAGDVTLNTHLRYGFILIKRLEAQIWRTLCVRGVRGQ